MALASTAGRDRPDVGGSVTVVLGGASYTSAVRRSGEVEIHVVVPRTRSGKLVRLSLGTELTVTWSDLGQVRGRPYVMVDVLGGSDPRWRLVPVATAAAGNRRLHPRAEVVVPMAVVGPDGIVVGSTVDLSTTGARIAFPSPARGPGVQPLPAVGEASQVVVVLEGARLEVGVHVVRETAHADGGRELRVAFTDVAPSVRVALDAAVGGLLAGSSPPEGRGGDVLHGSLLTSGGNPAPPGGGGAAG